MKTAKVLTVFVALWSLGQADGLDSDDPFRTIPVSASASVRVRDASAVCASTAAGSGSGSGSRSFVGFVDLDNDDAAVSAHTFFWFVAATHNPNTAPLTVWLNGGPGTDSLLGLFNVAPNLTTAANPHTWSAASNMLFLSQPVGVGFSYESVRNSSSSSSNGTTGPSTWTTARASNTKEAAVVAWDVLQTFVQALPKIDARVKTHTLHLWTESYGGHYGPTDEAFFRHFHEMNEKVNNKTVSGIPLQLGTLGIGSGIIDVLSQYPSFPDYAVNNTYNIQLVSEEVSNYMDFACHMPNGCVDQAQQCLYEYYYDSSSMHTVSRCTEATYMCRDNVEGPYYYYSGLNMYDIRRPDNDSVVSQDFVRFLNQPATRQALGIASIPELAAIEYAYESDGVYEAFAQSGDYAYPSFLDDIGYLLDNGVRVVLLYGDADYMANWFGGETVSLALNYSQASAFQATSYTNLSFSGPPPPDTSGASNGNTDGYSYGLVREHGNLSFAVVYDAGHFVSLDQPALASELFRRAVTGLDQRDADASRAGYTLFLHDAHDEWSYDTDNALLPAISANLTWGCAVFLRRGRER
ncbi:Peptidase S10, serine carboxypeptidase [Niveomyces insectorum RCEF 264]|uniref:Peptidase S10, serine carboxypeptidase n=1 Tax=Niveomyces insectorum RCEF 264 TaxID=1081102 RepID=A0A167X2X1_9HYPO|nr:Peptidase S10, serine carboxypeptidase [Niveomyces insectorum RCEF 264]